MADCVATCTPSQALQIYKCASCLSESELMAVAAFALADNNGDTVADAMECSSCYSCLSDKELLQTVVAKIAYAYLSRYTIAEIREQIKCLLCAPPGKVKAMLAYEICAYYDAVQ